MNKNRILAYNTAKKFGRELDEKEIEAVSGSRDEDWMHTQATTKNGDIAHDMWV